MIYVLVDKDTNDFRLFDFDKQYKAIIQVKIGTMIDHTIISDDKFEFLLIS